MVNYDNSGNTAKRNDDSELKMTTYAAFDGDLKTAFGSKSQYGQSLGVTFENAVLVDGALYKNKDNGKFKVFSWGALGYSDDMDYTAEDAPKVTSETYGSKTFQYELVTARVDDDEEDADYPAIGDGNVIMWESGGEKGPSSTAKTLARKLTHVGRAAILDESNINGWLADGVTLRDDLEGLRVRYFKRERDGNKFTFHEPVMMNLALGEEVTIKNTTDAPAAEPATDAEPDEAEAEVAVTDGGFTTQIQEFIGFCVSNEIFDGTAITATLNSMKANPESPVDDAMIGDREQEIVDAITAQAPTA